MTKTPLLESNKFHPVFNETLGKQVWGVMWGAVKKGFVRTVRHPFLSVNIRSTEQGINWNSYSVEYRDLESGVKKSHHFGVKRHGGSDKALAAAKLKRDEIVEIRRAYLRSL